MEDLTGVVILEAVVFIFFYSIYSNRKIEGRDFQDTRHHAKIMLMNSRCI